MRHKINSAQAYTNSFRVDTSCWLLNWCCGIRMLGTITGDLASRMSSIGSTLEDALHNHRRFGAKKVRHQIGFGTWWKVNLMQQKLLVFWHNIVPMQQDQLGLDIVCKSYTWIKKQVFSYVDITHKLVLNSLIMSRIEILLMLMTNEPT